MEAFVAQLNLTDVTALVAALQEKFGNNPQLRHALNGGKSTTDLCVAEIGWTDGVPQLITALAAKFTTTTKWSKLKENSYYRV
jgi:hypothetical protein